jgi:predicted  nucleic acid-binding Zn-ribbon protein
MALATQYWCSKKIVVTVKTGQKTVERVLPKPFAVVGRDPNCDLVLEDPELRGHLFYLHANEYGLYCTPINSDSDSGTIPQGWLGPDDLITCGGFQLSAHLEGQDTESGLPSPSWPRLSEYGSTLPPLPIVAIYRKGKFLAQRRIRAQLTLVGRNQPSLIRIPSRSLSRCHCALFWEAGTLWFVDLKSRSHCLVEGLKRQAGRFERGLRLQVGQYELEYLGQEGIQSFPGQAAQTGDADHGSRGFEELSSSHRIPGPPISDLEGHDLDDQDSREKQQLLEELGEAKRVQEMLQTRLDELGKIEERHAEHLSEQQSNYRQLQESHQRLQGDYEQLELELKGRDEAAVGRHEELQKQTDKLTHQLAESQKTAQEKSELVSEQAERLVSIEGDFEELQKQFEESRALDQELREDAKELKKRLGEAESLVEQREAELKITREEIRDLNLIRQEWIEGAGESESQLSELQVQLAAQKVAVEEAVEEAERQLREIETERDELRTANLNLCEDLKTLRAQLEEMGELEKRNVELVSELGSLQERLDERSQASETDRLDWSEKVETLQAELLESKALQDRQRQQADENRDELSQELEELQQRFDQQLTEISRIHDDSSRRQNELEDRGIRLLTSQNQTR